AAAADISATSSRTDPLPPASAIASTRHRSRRHAEPDARGGALEEEPLLPRILRERGGALELGAGLLESSQLDEQVAAHARKQVVARERRFRVQRVDQLETGLRAEGHLESDGAVELYDRRRGDPGEQLVEGCDARPVRPGRGAGPRMAGR